MKDYLKKQIKKAKVERNLFEIAIRTMILETPSDFTNIKEAYETYTSKTNEITSLEAQLEKALTGEAKEREDAKRALGIGG